MDSNVRKAALRAAAKTAIALSLSGASLGVGGCLYSHDRPAPNRPVADASHPVDAVIADAATAPDAGPPPLDCASHFANATVDRDPWPWAFEGEIREDPNTPVCCEQVLADEDFLGLYEARWGCCELLGETSIACTPWGPPCPPDAPV